MRSALRLALAGCLGLATALLVSCGGSGGASLIPSGNAGPLKDDFAAVSSAVNAGDCSAAATAVQKARSDLDSLPSTVDAQLRAKLQQGVDNLATIAPTECKSASTGTIPTTATTVTTTPPTTATTVTTTPPTTTTQTTTTSTQTIPTTTTTTPDNGGGATAPGTSPGGGGQGNGGSGGAQQGNGQ